MLSPSAWKYRGFKDWGTPGITKEYTYMWRWWYNPTPTEDSSFHYAGEGRHYLTVLDSNQCQFDTSYYIDYVIRLLLTLIPAIILDMLFPVMD